MSILEYFIVFCERMTSYVVVLDSEFTEDIIESVFSLFVVNQLFVLIEFETTIFDRFRCWSVETF